PIGQLVMIFAVMALHAAFAAWLLGQPTPVAAEFYTALGIVGDPLADQRLGAILAWVLGELPVILSVVVLVLRWTRDDQPPSTPPPAWRTPNDAPTSTPSGTPVGVARARTARG
ncbi:MAG TPA: cytochrome c oxidase assembly protein, partial [Pseudonocardia sp.]|uniref:cytochrome c oxidase assembly protein n=1 Tax=Pseudonocardia sp. TaxID=60912 RepID=UPI002CFD5A54